MYLNEKKNKVFMEINYDSAKCMLLIFSVPGGKGECSVRDSGKRGKED
jgi:hypothetical protein